MNGYRKAKFVREPERSGPWKTLDGLDVAILGRANRFSQEHIHGLIGDVESVKFERAFEAEYRQAEARQKKHLWSLCKTQGGSMMFFFILEVIMPTCLGP